ncbi:MAG: hypothetical protein PHQ59_00375 [Candidatus Daviesbacteria bacterium]|nr:hypothetical protein [Candidatus Daviesbacteria bacterium]
MLIIKKLIFAIPFLLSITAFYIQAEPILKDPMLLFSFDLNLLLQLIYFAVSITATAYFFITFTALASDWKIVAPISLVGSALVLLFIASPEATYLGIGLFLAFCAVFALLLNKITKDPTSFHTSDYIIKPSGQLITIIVLITSAIVYLSISTSSQQMVTKMIDSVVNLSTEFIKNQQLAPQSEGNTQPSLPTLTSEQLTLLKQNPNLLKQNGIDPNILNQLDANKKNAPVTPQSIAAEAAKPMIIKQVTDMIQPYLPFVPFIIAFVFYLNFQFFTSITSLLFSPLAYLLFYILEKINFIRFETTTREVKKLVV